MKAPANRIRRRKKAAADGSFFKKESQEPGFFAETGTEPFFQPPAQGVLRKCAECEEENKSKGYASLVGDEHSAPEAQPWTNNTLDLTAETSADYTKGAGVLVNEKKVKSKGCADCEEDCVDGSGILSVKFTVSTSISLPPVPSNLTPCQQARVKTAIVGPLTAHEKQHVSAFETFNGTAMLPIKYHGCDGGYDPYLAGLADAEFERRKDSADAKSAALDPFSIPVDLCCKEPEPVKK
jgi:hypothetical protein